VKTTLSPSRLAERLKALSRPQQAIAAGLLVVVIGGIVAGVVVATGGKTKVVAPPKHSTTTSSTLPVLASDRCPLTDLPAPGLKVPQRPALLVKIGNEPGEARPQSGLNEADIVFDTPAEGFIMRYMAVYQCQSASAIGPTRSVRWVDYHIAREFVDPIIAFAGGINPNIDAVAKDSAWLSGANLIGAQAGAAYRTTTRQEPDNLFTSTTALWKLFPKKTLPPPSVFAFTSTLPAGAKPAADAALDFSEGTDVIWKWQPTSHSWLHTYSGATDIDTLTNTPVTTTNIVVEICHYQLGPYIESTGGSGDVESQTLGSGPGYILRGGRYIAVTWHRRDLLAPTSFTAANGQPVGLAPGRTWVEIMTTAQAQNGIHFTP